MKKRNPVGDVLTNVRIARRRKGMPPEVLGGWIVRQEEFPDSTKMKYIRKQLREAQEEEPRLGWQLEMRGTEKDWHAVEENPRNPFDLKSLSRLIGTKPLKVKLQKVAGRIQMSIERPTKALLRKFGGGKAMRPNERTWGTYDTKAEADRAVKSFSSGDRAAQIRKSYGIASETLRVLKTGRMYRVVGTKL